jgi:hypothetical protein
MNRADQEPSAAAYDEARTSKSVPAARSHDGRAALGIKGKLLLAFAGMAPLTGIASAVAWYAFTDVDRSVTRIAAESVVGMAASLLDSRVLGEYGGPGRYFASDRPKIRVRSSHYPSHLTA